MRVDLHEVMPDLLPYLGQAAYLQLEQFQTLSRVAAGTITIGRLDRHTLRRMHTPLDAPGTCGYETARRVGQAVAGRFDPVRPGD